MSSGLSLHSAGSAKAPVTGCIVVSARWRSRAAKVLSGGVSEGCVAMLAAAASAASRSGSGSSLR
eukprot:scaffold49108_cov48-Phaeocystis_antarctica.AAC.1